MRPSLLLGSLILLLPSIVRGAPSVRSDRPRLLFGGPGISVDAYRARCTSTQGTYARCRNGLGSNNGRYPGASLAAAYLVSSDGTRCTAAYDRVMADSDTPVGTPDAHGFISNNGRVATDLAIVRDWCDAALSTAQKTALEDRMVAWGNWYVAHDPIDVFHDDMPNVFSAIGLLGLSLAGTARNTEAQTFLNASERKWKDVILPAMRHQGDWWHEGMTYVQPSLGTFAWWLASWTTATDDDVAETYADLREGYLMMHAYALRPNRTYVYFGDTDDAKQTVELFSRWLVDLLGYPHGSTLAAGLSLEIKAHSRDFYDYAGADGWMLGILFDDRVAATSLSSLPTARWLSQGAQDVVVLRSGWDADDAYLWMTCGDYFGSHQHIESGSFQIFKGGQLTGSTGSYDTFDGDHWNNYYSQHSVHANVLTIRQPGEIFPNVGTLGGAANVNDGGQRPLRRNRMGTAFPSRDLATYLANKNSGPHFETGDLVHFTHRSCYDWVACDVTAAYNSPGHNTNGNSSKVTEVARQWVFFPPHVIVVFDRVESTDASYAKRFLLHVIGTQSTNADGFTLTNGMGTLVGRTLLPAGGRTTVVTNFEVDGAPHPPSRTGAESGGSRLEVAPATPALRDYFLHVMTLDGRAPAASVSQSEDEVMLNVEHGGARYQLSFAKQGALSGHVVVSGAPSTCNEDLGAVAASDAGTPNADASLGDAAEVRADAAATDIGGSDPPPSEISETSEDCSCGPRAPPTGGLAPWLALVVLAILRGKRSRLRKP